MDLMVDQRTCRNVLFNTCVTLQEINLSKSGSFEVELAIFEKNIAELNVHAKSNKEQRVLNKLTFQRQTTAGFMISEAVMYIAGMISLCAGASTIDNPENKIPLYVSISSFGVGIVLKIGANFFFHKQNTLIKKLDIARKIDNEQKLLVQFQTIHKLLKVLSERKSKMRKRIKVFQHDERFPKNSYLLAKTLPNSHSGEDTDDESERLCEKNFSNIHITASVSTYRDQKLSTIDENSKEGT